jgi:hypothetical protein
MITNQPPIAMCTDIEVSVDGNCQASITAEDVDGGCYDPDDGDTLTLSIDNSGPFSPGIHTVTLTVTDDSGESDSCEATVTVIDDTPLIPDLDALPEITAECFVEISDFPTATDNCSGSIIGSTNDPTVYNELGTYSITWTYEDESGNITTQNQTVNVVDTTAPVVEDIMVNPHVLWPPNHKMVLVTPTIIVIDNCDPIPTVTLKLITMNEGDETNTYDPIYDTFIGDGHTSNDIQVDEDGNIYLRAERSGKNDGRVYTLTFTVSDASGNSTELSVNVLVPHNQ